MYRGTFVNRPRGINSHFDLMPSYQLYFQSTQVAMQVNHSSRLEFIERQERDLIGKVLAFHQAFVIFATTVRSAPAERKEPAIQNLIRYSASNFIDIDKLNLAIKNLDPVRTEEQQAQPQPQPTAQLEGPEQPGVAPRRLPPSALVARVQAWKLHGSFGYEEQKSQCQRSELKVTEMHAYRRAVEEGQGSGGIAKVMAAFVRDIEQVGCGY